MYSFAMEDGEKILKKSLANLYNDDQVLNGAMYLTTERLVFVGYLMDITNKYVEEVPLTHIERLEPGKSLWVIPNVIKVKTIREQLFSFVVKGRNEWLQAIHEAMEQYT